MKQLASYLNDHLAGSVGAVELLEHCERLHHGTPLGAFFADIKGQIRADQKTLQDMMHSLGIEESNVRKAVAWAGEKAGRVQLTIAGNEPGSVGLVLTLEGLIMGITGKRLLWRALAAARLPQLSVCDLEELQHRAEQQIERIEAERIRAAKQAVAGSVSARP